MKTCPFCSSSINDDVRYCTQCGKDLTKDTYSNQCPRCYEMNDSNSHYCKSCGLSISDKENNNSANVTSKAPGNPLNSANTYEKSTGVKIAAILIFIVSSFFILKIFINIFTRSFDVISNSWNAICSLLNINIGIEILKYSNEGYYQGLQLNAICVIWFLYQAILFSWAPGYLLVILSLLSFILIKSNKLAFELKAEQLVDIRWYY